MMIGQEKMRHFRWSTGISNDPYWGCSTNVQRADLCVVYLGSDTLWISAGPLELGIMKQQKQWAERWPVYKGMPGIWPWTLRNFPEMQVLTEVHIWPWRTNLSNVADASALVTTGYFWDVFVKNDNYEHQKARKSRTPEWGKNHRIFCFIPYTLEVPLKHQ